MARASASLNSRPKSWHAPAWLPHLVGALLLGGLLLGVYGQRLNAPFIFDDSATLVENTSIRQLWPLWDGGPLDPPTASPVHARPLVNLSFAANYHFSQLDPTGYRATNLVIHFLAALVLWHIVSVTLRLDYFAGRFASQATAIGFATTLVWALHPLAIDSVMYVTQRTELLMGLCYLGTLALALRYWTSANRRARHAWLAAAVVTCAVGMFCKEMMASAPAMVMLFERTFIAGTFREALRQSWRLYVGLALTWIPLALLMLVGPVTPETGFGIGVPAHVWWLTQTKVLFLYLKLAVWPWPLVIHYEIPYLTTLATAWPWLLAAVPLAIATIALVWKRSAAGFALAWFFAVLSPTLVVPLVNAVAAERRMYVPLAALAAMAVVGLCSVVQALAARSATPRSRRLPATFAMLLIAIVTAVYVGLDRARLEDFASERLLWEDTVRRQPENALARVNLGIALVRTGESSPAIAHFSEAIRLDPRSFRAHYNLGRALEAAAQPAAAMEHYQAALAIAPNHAASQNNLGRLLENMGRQLEAIQHYREAIRIDPSQSEAHNNLGVLLLQQGFTHQAIEQLEQALELKPDLAAHTNLAAAYARAGRKEDAARTASRAIAMAEAEGNEELAQALNAAVLEMQRGGSQP